MARMDSPPPNQRLDTGVRQGVVAAGCALAWLAAALVARPAADAVVSVLVLAAMFVPLARRRHRGAAMLGAVVGLGAVAGLLAAVVAGFSGAPALWLFVAAMAVVAVVAPLVYAATLPTRADGDRR
jgi:hypothetical protein